MIKRYFPWESTMAENTAPDIHDDDYVKYTDHAAEVSRLEAEVKRLAVELKLAQQTLANVMSGSLKANQEPT